MTLALNTIHVGDCMDAATGIPALASDSVDAMVTDPPAGIGFMGKAWDGDRGGRQQWVAWMAGVMKECLRVLKPGAHALVWALPRTSHWTTTAIEDAGFEIRDVITHHFGTGFPKSLDVSKAIDRTGGQGQRIVEFKAALRRAVKASGKTRKAIDDACEFTMRFDTPYEKDPGNWGSSIPTRDQWETIKDVLGVSDPKFDDLVTGAKGELLRTESRSNAPSGLVACGRPRQDVVLSVHAPSTDAAKQWAGWGTALKPASEHWILARKPLIGTVAANVEANGTGGLNIDASRIGATKNVPASPRKSQDRVYGPYAAQTGDEDGHNPNIGRFPANVVFTHNHDCPEAGPCTDGCPAGELDRQSGMRQSGAMAAGTPRPRSGNTYGELSGAATTTGIEKSSGGASRFFYCAKPSASEKHPERSKNTHPTVKSVALMTYLVRLVTPPGGLVLDPFAGSGTTGIAAALGGWRFVGWEQDPVSAAIATARLREATAQGVLAFPDATNGAPAPIPPTDSVSHPHSASGGDLRPRGEDPSPGVTEQSEPEGIQETLTPGAGGQAADVLDLAADAGAVDVPEASGKRTADAAETFLETSEVTHALTEAAPVAAAPARRSAVAPRRLDIRLVAADGTERPLEVAP